MVSRRLWNALRRPPTMDSLFRRAYSTAEEPFPWYVGCAQWLGVFMVVPVIAFAGTIYSLGWAVGIANLIGRERARRRFDLISLTPGGPFGAGWTLALGYLYRHRTFRNVNQPRNLYGRVFLVALALALGGAGILGRIFVGDFLRNLLILMAVGLLTFTTALYVEHVQSIVLGVLAGLAAASRTEDGTNAQLFAFALYLGVQLFTYVGTIVIGFILVPSALRALRLEGVVVSALLMVVRLLILVGLREIIITAIWRTLVERLNATPNDLARLLDKPQ